MRLAAGARLGPYEIVAPLGAGGMGEVYRARDTRLGRDVAIKILARDTAASPDARVRFEREARTISQLSHPHICALYDVGESTSPQLPASSPYLVMELLAGETLAQRLASGPLPLELTLRYAAQIADALDKAHRAGIVHRDLKPGNVMLTASGVKLLDFGLAKPAPTHLQTLAETAAPLTGRGIVAGTVQYMAPEQLAGREADARTDIYALGAVIYEMATGHPVFGTTPRAIVPPVLDRVVRGCLATDPEERWQSAHDVGLLVRTIADAPPNETAAHVARRRWLPWALMAASLAAAAALAWRAPLRAAATVSAGAVRFAVPPPAGGAFITGYEAIGMAVSPDGSQVAFSAADATGRHIWVRSAGALDPALVAGTDGAVSLFWSPDGTAIAFFTDNKLRRVDPRHAAPVTICEVREGIGFFGSWGRDGRILFASVEGEAIYAVAASGGVAATALTPDPAQNEARVNWPFFLPDGQSFLYLKRDKAGGGALILKRPGGERREIMPLQSPAQYVDPGYLVFSVEGALLGRRFDAETGRVSGEPFSIAPAVWTFLSTSVAQFSASRSGTLAYQSHLNESRLVWFDHAGRQLSTIGAPGDYKGLRFSPDGRRLAFDRLRAGAFDVWQIDLERQVETRLTLGASSEGAGPWMPDGKSLFFNADAGGPPQIFRKDLITGADTQVAGSGRSLREPQDVSPDGRWLLFTERAAGGNDIWLAPTDGSGPATIVFQTPFEEDGIRFSPDGRSFSFMSNAEGAFDIYVSAFPPRGEKIRVSSGGGFSARWSRDGHQLFYRSGRQLMGVAVQTSPALRVGAPAPLFTAEPGAAWSGYDVAADGRFLAVVPRTRAPEQPLTVVLNWPASLDR